MDREESLHGVGVTVLGGQMQRGVAVNVSVEGGGGRGERKRRRREGGGKERRGRGERWTRFDGKNLQLHEISNF